MSATISVILPDRTNSNIVHIGGMSPGRGRPLAERTRVTVILIVRVRVLRPPTVRRRMSRYSDYHDASDRDHESRVTVGDHWQALYASLIC
jgi:hypothetical protein